MPTAKQTKVTKVTKSTTVVLKVAFPNLDDEGRKTLRRKMRAAIRAGTAEGKILAAHKIGTRWNVSPAMRKAGATVLNG
jgi:hypothetical protein